MKTWGDRTGPAVAVITLLAPISWGTTYVTITELLPADRPLFVALVRVAPAGLLLAAIGCFRSRWTPRGGEWRDLAILAFFNFGLFFPLLIVGVYRLPGGVAASIGGVQPLLVGMVAWLVTRLSMRRLDVIVGIVSAVGVAMVVIRPNAGIDPIGVAAALCANVSFSIGVVATKTLPAPDDRIAATGWQLMFASIVIAPVAWLAEGPPPAVHLTTVAGFAYLSLLATGAAFVIWFTGIGQLPTQAPPVLGLAAPLTGAALGWILLDEDLTVVQILGFSITISAIVYAATIGSRPATARTPSLDVKPLPDAVISRLDLRETAWPNVDCIDDQGVGPRVEFIERSEYVNAPTLRPSSVIRLPPP